MNFLEQIGKNIKEIRVTQKISQEQLAEISNLDRTYIQSIEKGKRNPSITVILKISKALEVSIMDILKGVNNDI